MTNITPNYLDGNGNTTQAEAYEAEVNLVWTKGTRKKAIGKTGYKSQKVNCVGSNAPTYYKLIANDTGKTIDHFLSMTSLKQAMIRRGITAAKKKAPTNETKDKAVNGERTITAIFDEGFAAGYQYALDTMNTKTN